MVVLGMVLSTILYRSSRMIIRLLIVDNDYSNTTNFNISPSLALTKHHLNVEKSIQTWE